VFKRGPHCFSHRTAQIRLQAVDGLSGSVEMLVGDVRSVTVFVIGTDRPEEDGGVEGDGNRAEIDYVGRLRRTFSLISDSVVMSG
jgi:hypothetical protein